MTFLHLQVIFPALGEMHHMYISLYLFVYLSFPIIQCINVQVSSIQCQVCLSTMPMQSEGSTLPLVLESATSTLGQNNHCCLPLCSYQQEVFSWQICRFVDLHSSELINIACSELYLANNSIPTVQSSHIYTVIKENMNILHIGYCYILSSQMVVSALIMEQKCV